jgi:hypothetical protein
MYTDAARTLGVVALAVTATAQPQVFTITLPATSVGTRYLRHLIPTATGSQVDADDSVAFSVVVGSVVTTGPILLADVKAFLPETSSTEDDLLQFLLDAAERLVARWIGSPVTPTVQTERHLAGNVIVLRQSRVVGPVVVTDTVTGAVITDYYLEPSAILSRYGNAYGHVTVNYLAGFDPLPADVRLAILYTVQHSWESQRGSTPTGFGGVDESFVNTRGFALPNRAKEYLAAYRRGQRVA